MTDQTAGDVTYRVVKDEPCNWPTMHDDGVCEAKHPCDGCNGDGTRMVEVAVVVNDDQPWMWVEVEP